MTEYLTLRIFDSDPYHSGHPLQELDDIEFYDGEHSEAAQEALELYASGMSLDDGYEPGDRLWGLYDVEFVTFDVQHNLTAEDLS